MRPIDYFFLVVAFTYITGEWRQAYNKSEEGEANFYMHDFRARLGPWTISLMWKPVKEPKLPIHKYQFSFHFRSTVLIKLGGKLFSGGLVT